MIDQTAFSTDKIKRAFLVFEGGGAKAVVHVATLRAVERSERFKVEGYAGTSAGAIFATLAAAGYLADEIIHFPAKVGGSPTSILQKLGLETGTDLFKRRHWLRLRLAKLLKKNRLAAVLMLALLLFLLVVPLLHFAYTLIMIGVAAWQGETAPRTYYHPFGFWFLVVLYMAAQLSMLLSVRYFFSRFRGLASLVEVGNALDKLLKRQFPEAKGRVSFGDLHERGVSLKIVASNLTTGKLELFSTESEGCRDIAVADAAVASAAVPFIFCPKEINGQQYCDGGIISNLPAWVFDSETLMDADAWVIGSKIDSGPAARLEFQGGGLFAAIFRTAVFGGEGLSTRGVSNYFPITLAAREISLLDFDYHRFLPELNDAYLGAVAEATYQIRFYLSEEAAHEKIHDQVVNYLSKTGTSRVRSSLARVTGAAADQSVIYKLWQCKNYEGHADRYLDLPHNGSLIGHAIATRKLAFCDQSNISHKANYFSIDKDGRLSDRTWKELSWSIVLPLVERSPSKSMSVAITFDGSEPLLNVKETQEIIETVVGYHWDRKGEQ